MEAEEVAYKEEKKFLDSRSLHEPPMNFEPFVSPLSADPGTPRLILLCLGIHFSLLETPSIEKRCSAALVDAIVVEINFEE